MHKRKFYLGFLLFVFLLFPVIVKADYKAKFIADGKCPLHKNATGNCFYADTSFDKLVDKTYWLDTGDEVTVITSKDLVKAPKSGNGSECKSTFAYVSLVYKNTTYKGYACSDNIKVAHVSDELKKEFQEAGFINYSYL